MKYNRRHCIPPDVCHHILSYDELKDKPKINGVELIHNKTSQELGLQSMMLAITNEQIDSMLRS